MTELAFPKPIKKAKAYKPYTFRKLKQYPSVRAILPGDKLLIERPKRKPKSLRTKLKKELDRVCSLIIRHKGKICVICGETNWKKLQNGHIFTRAGMLLRWDIREDGNCHVQCQACNWRHEVDQYPYFSWYIKKFGLERFDQLRIESKQAVAGWKEYELAEKLDRLKEVALEMNIKL